MEVIMLAGHAVGSHIRSTRIRNQNKESLSRKIQVYSSLSDAVIRVSVVDTL